MTSPCIVDKYILLSSYGKVMTVGWITMVVKQLFSSAKHYAMWSCGHVVMWSCGHVVMWPV
jgi:hypothetical protein